MNRQIRWCPVITAVVDHSQAGLRESLKHTEQFEKNGRCFTRRAGSGYTITCRTRVKRGRVIDLPTVPSGGVGPIREA